MWHGQPTSNASRTQVVSDAALPVWDEQVGITFTQNFISIAYNVTAIAQADSDGYGPAYLLNGLSTVGYWYQVGLSWQWPYTIGSTGYHSAGFNLNYEVFSSGGQSIFPTNGGGGLTAFSGAVNQGDTVLLNLYFSNGNVVMYAYDWNTRASASESYNAFGAAQFSGLTNSASDKNGFFTGLMTEWWHSSQYTGNQEKVVYSDPAFALSSAWLWADEYSGNNVLFSQSKFVGFSIPKLPLGFSSNGITEYATAYELFTGQMSVVPFTLGYSVTGGGTGYSPPMLQYAFNAQSQSVSFAVSSPVTFYIDSGSSWSTTNPLGGSSGTERWQTNQQTSATATASQAVSLTYYHQFYSQFGYAILGGGSGYSPPSVIYFQFGFQQSSQASSTWVDAGSSYSFPQQLTGSSSSQRWYTSTAGGVLSSSTGVTAAYYHQYPVSASFSILGGGNPSAPAMTSTFLGSQSSQTLTVSPQSAWVDAGSAYSITNPLSGSTSVERWDTNSATAGTASSATTVSMVYYHQYSLVSSYSIVGGGSPPAPTLSFSAFGGPASSALGGTIRSVWADAGPYSTTNPLSGSTSQERWFSSNGQGVISGPGTLVVVYDHQFYLTVAGQPALSQWYNSDSTATVNEPGVSGRNAGTGQRLTGYNMDTGSQTTVPPTSGVVTVSVVMKSSHTLQFSSTTQYQLALDQTAGQSLASVSPPTINGDNYWYDAGSAVNVVLNGVWGRTSGSGNRVVSYAVNGGSPTATSTLGTIAALSLNQISSPQSISVTATRQYQLSTPTGSVASATPPTLSGDAGWYDSGSAVEVNYSFVWNTVPNHSRLAATGYSVDGGAEKTLAEARNGTFSVAVAMVSPHAVNVDFVTQYYVAFSLADASGSKLIKQAALQITIGGATRDVPGSAIWLDDGTSFTVSKVSYEGLDVKPTNESQYSVTTAANVTLKNRVYDATVKVTDFLGLVASGAHVEMTLVNGTVLSGTTNGDGSFVASEIPLGRFSATVSSLGSTTQIAGDASSHSVTPASVLLGTLSLGILVSIAALSIVGGVFILRRISRGRATRASSLPPPPPPPPPAPYA